ncbi:MAG TPA: hypothetical protein PLU22_08015, partial [Polyangiaceae bacterium]|nr:hypothetical protein [Polyangiaceae bacterium]
MTSREGAVFVMLLGAVLSAGCDSDHESGGAGNGDTVVEGGAGSDAGGSDAGGSDAGGSDA